MAVPRDRGKSIPLLRQVPRCYWALRGHVRGTRAAAARCSGLILVEMLVSKDLQQQNDKV
jgi:hypothetical protein